MSSSERVILLALALLRKKAAAALAITEGEAFTSMDLCTVRVELRGMVANLDKMKAWVEAGTPCSE